MPAAPVIINVGNTNTRISDGNIKYTVSTALLAAELEKFTEKNLAAATVVPEWYNKLQAAGAFLVDTRHCAGLDLSLVDASTLGADRIANAIELMHGARLPAVAVDFGTAITFEAVDADKRFTGGAIMPGRRLLRKALNAGTAQLPEACLTDAIDCKTGRNTLDAISLGCDLGAVGAVKAVLRAVIDDLGGEATVIGTGGDVEAFAPFFPEMRVEGEDFTLRGIARAYEYEQKKRGLL